jgi:hypothetical protein
MVPQGPVEIHHHTREIVNNVPTYIALPLGGEPAAFVESPMPTFFAEPSLPTAVVADNWGMPPMAMAPVMEMEPVVALDGAPAAGPSEYVEHLQHLDGTWEHNRFFE